MKNVAALYSSMMHIARQRFDRLELTEHQNIHALFPLEGAALHVRKIVELIAFGCLLAAQQSLNGVPRDTRTQWNAEVIFKRLLAREIKSYPLPALMRPATPDEVAKHGVKATIEPVHANSLSVEDLTSIYQRTNKWLHELNPFSAVSPRELVENDEKFIWEDVRKLRSFIRRHQIIIGEKGFYCDLWERSDGQVVAHSLGLVRHLDP